MYFDLTLGVTCSDYLVIVIMVDCVQGKLVVSVYEMSVCGSH